AVERERVAELARGRPGRCCDRAVVVVARDIGHRRARALVECVGGDQPGRLCPGRKNNHQRSQGRENRETRSSDRAISLETCQDRPGVTLIITRGLRGPESSTRCIPPDTGHRSRKYTTTRFDAL